MKIYLGIDLGGTKTHAAVCDGSGRILGTGRAEGLALPWFMDREGVFLRNIRSASETALAAAGLTLREVSAVCGCFSGADWDDEIPVLTRLLTETLGCTDTLVYNDCIGAMRGGSSGPDCAVVCAGTGLNVAVRRRDGQEILYGYYVDPADQGGSALGHAALRAVMDADRGLCADTLLTGLVLRHTGMKTPEQLLRQISGGGYTLHEKELAGCLLTAYRGGDAEAGRIVQEFAASVSRYVIAGLRRLDLLSRPVDVVFSGSVFKDDGTMISKAIAEKIVESAPLIRPVDARYEPVCGALLLLLDRHSAPQPPGTVLKTFDDSASEHGLLRNITPNQGGING